MAISNNPSPFHDRPQDLKRAIESLKPRWRSIAALGAVIASMGIAALILVSSATIATVYTIAIFMILAGGAEIAAGISAKTWGRFFLWIAAGIAYIVAASFALAQPLVAAAFFTLLLGAGMIATGVIRIVLGAQIDAPLRGPLLFAGTLTFFVGVLIVAGWPENSVLILGVLLGLDLLFWGVAWIGLGLRLRRL
ncbi:MAG: DUF308 domain-containing protein [Beijerinckiaceae bacterium]|nr:DUF308 domain-containing protein [Beijerinckiaceae bacterium]MCI0737084.1 DUF308 domain-containing protein [Beijerinckiaceae bacterium]